MGGIKVMIGVNGIDKKLARNELLDLISETYFAK